LAATGALEAIQFTPNGTGGILALYTQPGANLARTLLNEFVSVSLESLALTIPIDLSFYFYCRTLSLGLLSGAVLTLPTSSCPLPLDHG
jgi:hypothetical protein